MHKYLNENLCNYFSHISAKCDNYVRYVAFLGWDFVKHRPFWLQFYRVTGLVQGKTKNLIQPAHIDNRNSKYRPKLPRG